MNETLQGAHIVAWALDGAERKSDAQLISDIRCAQHHLEQIGTDWHEAARAVQGLCAFTEYDPLPDESVPDSRRWRRMRPQAWRSVCQFCLERSEHLSDEEVSFVMRMEPDIDFPIEPSDAEASSLVSIVANLLTLEDR